MLGLAQCLSLHGNVLGYGQPMEHAMLFTSKRLKPHLIATAMPEWAIS